MPWPPRRRKDECFDSPRNHIPYGSRSAVALPITIFFVALVAIGSGIAGIALEGGPYLPCIHIVVVAALTAIVTAYAVGTECWKPEAYNYYAPLFLSIWLWLQSAAAGSLGARAAFVDSTNIGLILAVVSICLNKFLLLGYWIFLAVCISRHRRRGRKCTPRAEAKRRQTNMPATTPQYHNEVAQPAHQMVQIAQRGSVHYKPCDPYHPLRLNPADTDTQVNSQAMCSLQPTEDHVSGCCGDHSPEGQEGDLEASFQPCVLCEEEASDPVEDHDLAHCPTVQVVSSQEQLREHILDQCSKKRSSIPESIRGHNIDECVKAGASEPSQSHTLEQCGTTGVSLPENPRGHTLQQCGTTRITTSKSPHYHEVEECYARASSPGHPQSHSLHQCVETMTDPPQNVQSHEIGACPTIRVSPPEAPSNHELENCPTTQVTSEVSRNHSLEHCVTTEVPLQSRQDHRLEHCPADQVAFEGSQSHSLERCVTTEVPLQSRQNHRLEHCPAGQVAFEGSQSHTLAQCPTSQTAPESPQDHQLSQCTTTPVPGRTKLQDHVVGDCVTITATSQGPSRSHSLGNCVPIDTLEQSRNQSHSLDDCPASSTAGNANQCQGGGRASF